MSVNEVSDELWEEFHHVVNMTSKELVDWLLVSAADEDSERFLDESGDPVGQRVVHILGKRRTDLDASDIALMARVVRRVRERRGDELEPTAGDAAWRHDLMSLGHDPLKPPR